MDRLISEQAVIKILILLFIGNKNFKVAINSIKTIPSAEPKTGHWIKTISENGITSAVRCSECGFEDNRYMLFRYCPYCGAKMESEDKE